jgi:two-component system chemotaxis sensor kinase CheA
MLTDEEIMAQVLAAFQEEQAEHRETATNILLELEREPDHPKYRDLLDQLFREAHSLKGGARAAGLDEVEQIAHRIEDAFSAVRQGRLQLTPDVCDTIYEGLDAIGVMMNQVAAGQNITLEPYQHILDTLSTILGETREKPEKPDKQPSAPTEPPPAAPETTVAGQTPRQPEDLPAESAPAQAQPTPAEPDPASAETTFGKPFDEKAETARTTEPYETNKTPEAPELSSDAAMMHPSTAQGATQGKTAETPEERHQPKDTDAPPQSQGSADMPWEAVTTVRLATATLDSLLNETGELITCSVRAQQRSREAHLLSEIAVRWRRVWRQIRPVMNRLQEYLPAFQPTVHHLSDRETARIAEQMTAKLIEEGNGELSTTAISSQLPILLDGLGQANELLSELEQQLGIYARQMTDDYTRLSVVTDRLHDQIRRTRMLPITTLFSPLRIQVREVARAAGKQIDLLLDDGGAEADRQVLERLREVLLHLLRNAVDHGIEPPDVRVAHGKSSTGHILLNAVVSGDYLTLTIEDDGAGIDLEAVRQRALSSGLMSETDLARATEAELIDLIFLAGFTTRKVVSKMSGRGVGLDVVRSQVERMHGRVAVQSVVGAGSIFTISVPLSLTSSHGLLLRVDQATHMIPLDSIQRIVAVAPSDIQLLEGRACLMIDDRPTALVHLSDIIGKSDRPTIKEDRRGMHLPERTNRSLVDGRASGSGWSLALLLGSGERQVACMVDGVLGEQELVVYRLPAPLQRVRFIAGATILADGSVVPILDVVDVVRAAIGVRHAINTVPEAEQQDRRATILVVDDSITTRTLEKNILEAAGYQVRLATDGVEALESLRHLLDDGGCDLLLSDIDMPRLNGFDLTSQIRSDTNLKHIPIVLVTSLDSSTDRERGIAAGADAYIVKRAFDQQSLLDTIEQLI